MTIEAAIEATPELHAAMARLLPQLNSTLPVPTHERLQAMIDDPDVTLLLARDGETIVGTATVIVYTTPFWLKARLDEVVVDQSARGKGVGELLVRACLDVARRGGAQIAELQSGRGEARDAANRLYRRLGFEPRDTNVYRIVLS
ncbi:MAG: GNAT family N-acetyltransferase [Candidatus Dormibacterales bacterium]